MSSSSNMYWKCDPYKHIPDETYTEVTQLLQVNLKIIKTKLQIMVFKKCKYYIINRVI